VDTTKIIFDCPLPPWVVLAAAAAVLGAVAVFVRRDAGHLRASVRRVILGLVVLALLMLTGLVLSPKFIRTWLDPHKPLCTVVVDASRSMGEAESYEGPVAAWVAARKAASISAPDGKARDGDAPATSVKVTREELVRLLLGGKAEGGSVLAKLGESFELAGWRFAETLSAQALGPDAPPFAVDPEGFATDLGDALDEAVHRSADAGGSRPRAVVLVSDGAWNTGRDPSEVARMLGRLGVPVFVIGVGLPNPPRDVAVLAVRGPESVHLGDEVFLTAEVAATGMGAARLPVRLTSGADVLAEKQVVTLPDGRPVTVSFTFLPDAPGRRTFTVGVPKQEGEENDANNAAAATVEVTERKIRTLLVEGRPRWEYRFLRNVCERDPAVQLTTFLLRDDMKKGGSPTAGPNYLSKLPTEEKGLLDFDLVILGDVPREGLPDRFLELLAARVRDGGALAVIAGRRGGYRSLAGTPVADILPVALAGAGSEGQGGPPFAAELTQDGLNHLVTRLASDPEENEAAWSRLPKLRWSADVAGLARGATALLVHPYRQAGITKLPLLAVAQVGTGKVLWLGTEDTWRWRQEVGDKVHYRFWAQALRWLIKKQFAQGDPRARLSLDKTKCDLGETVEIEAYCLGPGGFPLEDARVWVRIDREGGESRRIALEARQGGWGLYRAVFKPTDPGVHTVRPIVSVYGEEPLGSSATFTVARPDLEKKFLAQDVHTLSAVAQASAGEYVRIEESDRLPTLLAAKVERRVLTAERSPCRHWAYYTALALVLGAAWLVRKRSGLA
jgi:hypothetical protein